jgi:TatD DNase family protein
VIDSHCHLTDLRLREQLDDVLRRATNSNVTRIVTIGTSVGDARNAIDLCHARENLRCAIGIHPNYSHEAQLDDVGTIRQLQPDPSVVALGEMGLDYHYDFADRDRQRQFFEAQLALASELRRPVVIHCREAVDDALAIMKGFPKIGGAVFHCFTGTVDEAKRIIGAGYYLGFTGAATFKKNDELREAARITPRDRLLVETDAPYLSPEPMRKQKVNEPALVVHVAETIARVWDVAFEEVDRITTENVTRLFNWPITPAC